MEFPFKLKVHFLTSLCTWYLNFADRKWFHTHKETFVQKKNCVKGLVEGLSLCSWFWAGSLFQPQCAQPQPNPVHRPNRDCPLPLSHSQGLQRASYRWRDCYCIRAEGSGSSISCWLLTTAQKSIHKSCGCLQAAISAGSSVFLRESAFHSNWLCLSL